MRLVDYAKMFQYITVEEVGFRVFVFQGLGF